jgi:hypothetical protein
MARIIEALMDRFLAQRELFRSESETTVIILGGLVSKDRILRRNTVGALAEAQSVIEFVCPYHRRPTYQDVCDDRGSEGQAGAEGLIEGEECD